MTQATNDIIINERVRLTRRVGDRYWFTETWAVYQDDVKIGYVYGLKGSDVWRWKTLEANIGGFNKTKWDATDALIRYTASP